MKWPRFLQGPRYATVDDVRKIFADYHDALHWLAGFLVGEKLSEACIVDACTIAERQGPMFHEWLAHWAARATLHIALQMRKADIAELGPSYERFERVPTKRPPLSAKDLQLLVEHSDALAARLDALCRFVFVMHGIAKEPRDEVAGQLGASARAIERAYCVAYDTLHLISAKALCDADAAPATVGRNKDAGVSRFTCLHRQFEERS